MHSSYAEIKNEVRVSAFRIQTTYKFTPCNVLKNLTMFTGIDNATKSNSFNNGYFHIIWTLCSLKTRISST